MRFSVMRNLCKICTITGSLCVEYHNFEDFQGIESDWAYLRTPQSLWETSHLAIAGESEGSGLEVVATAPDAENRTNATLIAIATAISRNENLITSKALQTPKSIPTQDLK
jgi:hypothetical protein